MVRRTFICCFFALGGLSSRQPALPTHGISAHAADSLVRTARTSCPRGHSGGTEDVEAMVNRIVPMQ
jgi:hypothetical protein